MNYPRSLDTSDWIALGAVLVATAAAVISAWQAHIARTSAAGQLALAERVHREANEPYVIVDVQPREPWSFLFVVLIENVGPTVARNVRISVTPELESSQGPDVSTELREALARTVPIIPPGRRLAYFFDTNGRWGSGLPMVFEFEVNATGPYGPMEAARYLVDLNVLGANTMLERPSKKLEDEVQKVRSLLKSLGANYEAANLPAIRQAAEIRREEGTRRREQIGRQLRQDGTGDSGSGDA
ncbi:hypothetical protein OG209_05045 [Streptomyces sp. NBC_01383]|uniref:hypothetical protein n=1 Tax=Streptomyces sp. NBC_01383 TaxID=2903846 RepID=UPI003252677A